MGSLYNMVFGESDAADALLSILGLDAENFYRYRDCYLSEDGEIAVYTRMGGNNREMWKDEDYEKLTSHPLYLRDEDQDFDNTYATFYFKVPDDAKTKLEGIVPEKDRGELWEKFFEGLKK